MGQIYTPPKLSRSDGNWFGSFVARMALPWVSMPNGNELRGIIYIDGGAYVGKLEKAYENYRWTISGSTSRKSEPIKTGSRPELHVAAYDLFACATWYVCRERASTMLTPEQYREHMQCKSAGLVS